jgi:hypothetical protein
MMKIGRSRQVMVVQMPLVDLGCLCLLPDFRQLMARFPRHIKVNMFLPSLPPGLESPGGPVCPGHRERRADPGKTAPVLAGFLGATPPGADKMRYARHVGWLHFAATG